MNLNEYQEKAMRTRGDLTQSQALINTVLGLCGEAGELSDHIKKHLFQGHPLDKEYIKKELGDILWYIALGADAIEDKLENIGEINILKLMKRYPNGFSVEKSINREE